MTALVTAAGIVVLGAVIGILAVRGRGTASDPRPAVASTPLGRWALAAGLLAMAAVIVSQVDTALELLSPDAAGTFFFATNARPTIAVNAALAVLTAVAAYALPARLRPLALLPGVGLLAVLLGSSLTLGGHLWPAVVALLTAAAAWQLGRWTLSALRASALQGIVLVEVVVGAGILGLFVILVGRLGLLAWWNVGVVVVAVGGVALWGGAVAGYGRRRDIWSAATHSPVAVASIGIACLTLGWASVWLAAPDIMYDAIYGKGYLPQLWADTGRIGPLVRHPVLNIAGLAQVVAVPGHTLDAPDVGRWLQFLALPAVALTLWRLGGARSAVGPLFALAIVLVPHLIWQTATAFDDAILVLVGAALGLAIHRTMSDRESAGSFAVGVALGLLGGSAIWFKLHLAILVVVVLVGWVLCAGPLRGLLRRTLAVGVGGVVIAAPTFVLRWIDTGNPFFPSYNDIFKSRYYPPINETFNFPFWPDAGSFAWLKLPYEAVVNPVVMSEATPAGAYGLLVPATLLAVLFGWYQRERRVGWVLWVAIVVGLAFWWTQFRYLRYAMPIAVIGVILLELQARRRDFGPRVAAAALVGLVVLAAAALPTTVATFWNVPDRAIPYGQAAGRWDDQDYLRKVFAEKDALDAFQRNAPEGAVAVGDAHQRTFLKRRDLSPAWEVGRLLEVTPGATTGERLRNAGIGWALVANGGEALQQAWLDDAVRDSGEIVFADRGFSLYRLTDSPRRPQRQAVCDPTLRARANCWNGTLDRTPGLTAGEHADRTVEACPGTIAAIRVTTGPEGTPAGVSVDPDGATGLSGYTTAPAPAGKSTWVYATVPEGSTAVSFSITPGEGGTITRAETGVVGSCSR